MKKYLLAILLIVLPGICGAANISLNDVSDALQNPFKADVVRARGTDKSGIFDFRREFIS